MSLRKRQVSRGVADDLRGIGQLAIDGVIGAAELVEATHAAITYLPAAIGRPAPAATTGVTGLAYRSVRGLTRLVGDGMDLSLSAFASTLGSVGPSPWRDAILSAINGVLGDHLEASGNPLAIPMRFRRDGQELPLARGALRARLPQAGGKLLVMVHGLCMNDRQWKYDGHDHGEALARTLGYTPVYLHYNSGRRISDNGRELAGLLERLLKAWPVDVEDVVFLCHSMGGLVVRSALEAGLRKDKSWTRLPLRAVFLGTPHHGAPLERAGNWAEQLIAFSPYSAPFVRLSQLRSAGIQDLRHGNLLDRDWKRGNGREDNRTPLPLPAAVRAYAIAATTQAARRDGKPRRLSGDGLVPVASALGDHANPAFDLGIPASRRWIGYGINHLELLGDAAVYARIRRWLKAD
ncbi:esterase/lipase family protein [Luteimonas aquatica]|uniref:esterase/lipase family protein n=1 Tax=Luteimonas aquatica TaxID=450364 RepID=UPI001F58447B|nr:alpha/beta hydrolase [Luteimonas aquatica]